MFNLVEIVIDYSDCILEIAVIHDMVKMTELIMLKVMIHFLIVPPKRTSGDKILFCLSYQPQTFEW